MPALKFLPSLSYQGRSTDEGGVKITPFQIRLKLQLKYQYWQAIHYLLSILLVRSILFLKSVLLKYIIYGISNEFILPTTFVKIEISSKNKGLQSRDLVISFHTFYKAIQLNIFLSKVYPSLTNKESIIMISVQSHSTLSSGTHN